MKTILLLLSILFTQVTYCQFAPLDASVIIANDTLKNAWAGGFNSPQFSEIDLDFDGINDLFVFERNGNIIKTFINNGTSGMVDYHYAPEYREKFPLMHAWTLLADYDCDGKNDVFTSDGNGIKVYKNTGTLGHLSFSLAANLILSDAIPLYVTSTDLPAIVDLDNDGDLDLLVFSSSGMFVEWHKNLSKETYGSCDSLIFSLADNCWGKFSENASDNGVNLGISCRPEKSSGVNNQSRLHAGSAILAFDLDGDGDKEVALGDISFNNMVLLTNGGSSTSASMISQDPAFPSNSTPVNLSIFPAGFHFDVNNDGVKDLLVAPNNAVASENFKSAWYYKNSGTSSSVELTYQKKDFLQDGMIEFGAGAYPIFFDHNGDGLYDLIVGNDAYFDNGNFSSKLALFENIGSISNPVFELITRDYNNIGSLGKRGLYPAFGDIDNDGDQDMIVGDRDGNVHLYLNTAGAFNTANFILNQPLFKGIDVGKYAAPQLIDVNRNGMLDLIIGEMSGTINYFENIGTITSPDFDSSPDSEFFGGIDVMPFCCTGYSTPFLTEDSTGSHMLYVGAESGYIYRYNNIDGNIGGTFDLMDSINSRSYRASVSGADINNNGRLELAIGEYSGGMGIYYSDSVYVNGLENISQQSPTTIYPNPTSEEVFINAQDNINWIDVYNRVGVLVKSFESSGGQAIQLDMGSLANGMYILQIHSDSGVISKKLILSRR